MLRPLALLLALWAPAAAACAVAEGCPMGDPPARSCAIVRVAPGFVCIDDPTNPAGFVIVPDGGTVPPGGPDCGPGEDDGCVLPAPRGPSLASAGQAVGAALAMPVAGLLVLLGLAGR